MSPSQAESWGFRHVSVMSQVSKEKMKRVRIVTLFIPLTNSYIVVAPSDVEFCIYVCVTEISDEVRNQRKGILVLDCDGVNLAIVLDRSHFAILLSNEEKGRCVWQF